MTFIVTITRPDGYVFNNGFDTLHDMREFLKIAALVLMPGETLSFTYNPK